MSGLGMRLLCLLFYRLCYSPMLHIMSDYAPPYSDYAPTCSNYALQYSSNTFKTIYRHGPKNYQCFLINT